MDENEVRVRVDGRTLRLSNLDKVLYPATGTTKAEVLRYYATVAPVLLPHLAGRAVTRIRWPDGVGADSFFEKNAPAGAPSWLRTVEVPTTGSRSGSGDLGTLRFPVVDSLAALTYLANLASLELHVHQWTVDAAGAVQPPDRLVVDLDPGEPAGLAECARVALWVRDRLAGDGLSCAPVTSGAKGLHLYADAGAARDLVGDTPDGARDYARSVAEELQAAHPDLVLAGMTRARRRGKVFWDWSQNAGSKTTVSPYSLRGRERPTVAAPRTWAEVEAGAEDPLALDQLGFEEVLRRVEEDGDLFGFSPPAR